MIITLGAVASAYLGFRLYERWVPAALAGLIVVLQYAMYRVEYQNAGMQLYLAGYVFSLIFFYATYGIGRAIAQRFKSKR